MSHAIDGSVPYDLAGRLKSQEETKAWLEAEAALAATPAVLTLLSPSNLPMENDPDVLQVARAIAERGIGRYWDDFPETDAFDTDQGDLIEYARAAVEIFRARAATVCQTCDGKRVVGGFVNAESGATSDQECPKETT